MIKNININEHYDPYAEGGTPKANFINCQSDINLFNIINKNNASLTKSRSSKSRSRSRLSKCRSRSKKIKKKIYNNITLPKITLKQNVSILEIREYLSIIAVIKPNTNCPDELLKYLYLSTLYDNINIKKQF
jgi:hypothetical protein